MSSRIRTLLGLVVLASVARAADAPRGFFVEDLRLKPPVPAFYNLETQQLQAFPLKKTYSQFIDFYWDHDHDRVFFSAREPKQPFRMYVKDWPDGEEKQIYENPLGPFRFLPSPDGRRMALQIMGPWTWPTLGVYDWQNQQWTPLGQGYSPDWSEDSQSLLYLHLNGSLPTWLFEYTVAQDTGTQLLPGPVIEAAYSRDTNLIILKRESEAKACDVFQLWNRQKNSFALFSAPRDKFHCKKDPVSQRELGVFPGHEFFYFKESPVPPSDNAVVVVTDVWGQRLQTIDREDWDPQVAAVGETYLAMGQDPLYLVPADGTGGRKEISQTAFIRMHH